MIHYKIYYQTPETFHKTMGFNISHITLKDIDNTHVYLKDIKVNDLNDVFRNMQGEIWSPNGEARELIKSKGLKHTSMSVGDVVCETGTNKWFVVDFAGFKELVKTKNDSATKTQQEIEDLKQNWLNDPCWALSETEGFEDYKNELKAFEDHHESLWSMKAQQRKEKRIQELKDQYNNDIWEYIYYLEQQLKKD